VELTLEDLAREVAARIQRDDVRQGNGQVSPLPDRRTLRYYTTIGLLDRPLAMRGRQAVYGDRHVLQAVAVKRMQAAGLSLGEIQARLAGLPTPELAQVAEAGVDVHGRRGQWWTVPASDVVRMPAGGPSISPAAPPAAPLGTAGQMPARSFARRSAFADAPPATASPASVPAPLPAVGPSAAAVNSFAAAPPASDPRPAPTRPVGTGPAMTLTGVPLGEATTLLIPADRLLTEADMDAIRRAAAPLTDYLAAVGLTRPRPDPKDRS
jgi:DNA-binding transcriptional MerR regulator